MNQTILNFLSEERVGVISVILEDGAVHSATVHYSHDDSAGSLKIYIQTSNDTLKVRPFLRGHTGKGAITIGFSEEKWITLQMHGNVRTVLAENELEEIYKIHYKKNPHAEKYKGPDTVFLEFTPTWWRYTDFNTEPETVLGS